MKNPPKPNDALIRAFTSVNKKRSNDLGDWIECFLEIFPNLTQAEANFINEILRWEDNKRIAFHWAKKIFEES